MHYKMKLSVFSHWLCEGTPVAEQSYSFPDEESAKTLRDEFVARINTQSIRLFLTLRMKKSNKLYIEPAEPITVKTLETYVYSVLDLVDVPLKLGLSLASEVLHYLVSQELTDELTTVHDNKLTPLNILAASLTLNYLARSRMTITLTEPEDSGSAQAALSMAAGSEESVSAADTEPVTVWDRSALYRTILPEDREKIPDYPLDPRDSTHDFLVQAFRRDTAVALYVVTSVPFKQVYGHIKGFTVDTVWFSVESHRADDQQLEILSVPYNQTYQRSQIVGACLLYN